MGHKFLERGRIICVILRVDMQTKKIIIGNWKMNPLTLKEAESLFRESEKAASKSKKTKVIICAPFLYLDRLSKLSKNISLGAQDAYFGETGAFTGEVSASMLYYVGARYVLVGHSERRTLGDNNEMVNRKLKASLASGLSPILCVGENSREDNHAYFNFVKEQLTESLSGIKRNSVSKLIIAYEPVWAISSTLNRKDATSLDCREMSIFIRKVLSDKFGPEAMKIKVIYGGSVKEKDAEDFLKKGGVDGLLPGRASLNAKKFSGIINIADNI